MNLVGIILNIIVLWAACLMINAYHLGRIEVLEARLTDVVLECAGLKGE